MAIIVIILGLFKLLFIKRLRFNKVKSNIFYLNYKPSNFELLVYFSFLNNIPKIILKFNNFFEGTNNFK